MFDQLVMAGGGGRCTWQLGFLSVVAPELGIQPRVICAVSAGSLMACIRVACDEDEAREYFARAFGANRKNAYWGNLFRSERVFPQYGIYRRAIHDLFGNRMQRLRSGPDIRIGVTHFPRWLGTLPAFAIGAAAYNYDKRVKRALHPTSARKLGFTQEFASVRDCASVEQLADLILHSSCSPPITPLLRRNGRPVIDGGVVDNIPVQGLDPEPGDVLVLLTRPYRSLPRQFVREVSGQRRLYVQPSRKTPVEAWDYTSPHLIEQTFELGKDDGKAFLQDLQPPASST